MTIAHNLPRSDTSVGFNVADTFEIQYLKLKVYIGNKIPQLHCNRHCPNAVLIEDVTCVE